ncbi:MAG: dipeptidase [Gammaproteobacteria bacterium]|nr:dipeptidase [Gammaproteobacteria bacterium]
MMHRLVIAALCVVSISACGRTETPDTGAAALRIARDSIIVDTHIDVPYRLKARSDDVSAATASGDFDYPRALSGGLNAAFMSIYTPASLEVGGQSRAVANELIDIVEGIVAQSPDKFAIARSPADIREQFAKGLISLPMGMENGSPLEGDLANLQYFYERGIRYITLAHGLSNHLADSSYDTHKQWNGLSQFGAEVVAEMNRLGIMVDVSHLSDDAFWQVIEFSNAPVIASHSSARHFTPGFERNMTDEMIKALADQGGVIQINFGSGFITAEACAYSMARSESGKAYAARHPELSESDLYRVYPTIFEAEHGKMPFATLGDVLDHIDHVVTLTSIDHVGIGSDFDGVGDSLPIGLKDVSNYPNLIRGLLDRGYSEADIRKILGENLLRVWQAVDDYAATTSSST